jgi:hypothetical protein
MSESTSVRERLWRIAHALEEAASRLDQPAVICDTLSRQQAELQETLGILEAGAGIRVEPTELYLG